MFNNKKYIFVDFVKEQEGSIWIDEVLCRYNKTLFL